MKVLITCGATWQSIDDVRVISNISTGQMGHLIAQAFKKKGARVTVIEGPVNRPLEDKGIKVIKYRFFDEFAQVLKTELLKKYDFVIHAAAVSDFKAAKVHRGKIGSSQTLTLRLVATEKLIDSIKILSPKSRLVGFKLEPALNRKNIFKAVERLFTQSGCDWVVANTLKNGYKGYIVSRDGAILSEAHSKEKMARALIGVIARSEATKQSF